mmetsp:Transcript_49453/g.96719  ORF Transcript_49453/g.96719 Transcript_49453/m.96719 type:complete len:836 (-) Transcript_49453:780-3287(-)
MNERRTSPGLSGVHRRKSVQSLLSEHRQTIWDHRTSKVLSYSNVKSQIVWFLDHAQIKISNDDFMFFVTLYVLFGDEIRLLFLPPSVDNFFIVLNTIALLLFVVELILNSWVKSEISCRERKIRGFLFNFFFWLDLLAIISMIPDVPWLSSYLSSFAISAFPARSGRITLGVRAGRVVRMARIVRVVKLYKVASRRKRESNLLRDLEILVQRGKIGQEEMVYYFNKLKQQKQSRVGAELSDMIIRRVIVAILIMLCVVPIMTYSPSIESEQESIGYLNVENVQIGTNTSSCESLQEMSKEFKSFMDVVTDHENYLVGLKIFPKLCDSANIGFENEEVLRELREEYMLELESKHTYINKELYVVKATFNLDYIVRQNSEASVYLTLFVLFMLVTLAMQFTGDAEKLVLQPIESMMEMIQMVADDPLVDFDGESFADGQYETRIIQLAIQKIATLLRIGFGIAGAEIISKNMAIEGGQATNSMLDPMVPGKRMYAVFGFCDIHNFDLCTERLEDEIMAFINNVARIVHEEVARWGGLCNKNLGNAFLMVWRIGDEDYLQEISRGVLRRSNNSASFEIAPTHEDVDLRRIPGLDKTSDKALIGFLKVVVAINKDAQALSYRRDKRLMKDDECFKLRMGFGLHTGWAIEGAVGSLHKVDATYLSPHVNMAARMEAASKQFGVAILMTQNFFELMSTEAQANCRKVDVVTVKGSAVPVPIFTYDSYQDQIFVTHKHNSIFDTENRMAENYTSAVWGLDDDLVKLRRLSVPAFRKSFGDGLGSYLDGNWREARVKLERSNCIMEAVDPRGDGPSKTILNYMRARDWICPEDWRGFRPLTSK